MRRIGAHFFYAFWHIFLMSAYFFSQFWSKKRRKSTHASKQQERKQAPKLAKASKLCNHGRQKNQHFPSGCAQFSYTYAVMPLFGQVGGS